MDFATEAVKALAYLNAIGVGTWGLLILIDTVAGMVVRSGSGGQFNLAYIQQFLSKNFATTEVKAMAGLIMTAVVSAVLAHLNAGGTDVQGLLQTVSSASLAAFVAGVASQDAALVKDIASKFGGKSAGQVARASRGK